jgi:hypothetical protein
MIELKELGQYAPQLLAFAGAILLLFITVRLIIFVKRELFSGVVSLDMYAAQVEREKKVVEVNERISNRLQEIVEQLSSLTSGVNEQIGQNTERLRSLEHAMSDYLEAFQRLNHNFELHRRGYTDTEQLRVIK